MTSKQERENLPSELIADKESGEKTALEHLRSGSLEKYKKFMRFCNQHSMDDCNSPRFFAAVRDLAFVGATEDPDPMLTLAVAENFPGFDRQKFYGWNDFSEDSTISLKSVETEQELEPEWLVPGYIPRGEIFLIAGDGGSGKTSLWCSLAADISSGRQTILEKAGEVPEDFSRTPETTLFFSSEDSTKYTLRSKLRRYGADMSKIHFLPLDDPNFPKIKFNSPELAALIRRYQPALCVLDPVQSFLPPGCEMSSRNQMRDALNCLIGLGELYGTTFCIIVHANKRSGVSARKRISDSSDLWDISRAVLTVGQTTEDGIFYASPEKNNYGALSKTVLFRLTDGLCTFAGSTNKRDADFVGETTTARSAPAKESAHNLILDYLDGGEKPTKELDEYLKASGVSSVTSRRVKSEMKSAGEIRYRCEKSGSETVWYTVSCA